MNKFICVGTIVKSEVTGRTGKVIDVGTHTAIMQDDKGFWTAVRKDLKVISYKEVE